MKLSSFFIVLGAYTALLGALPLAAQQASSSSSGSTEEAEVIITASGAEEEELASSAFTTVITAEEIAEMGRTDLTEVLSELAGIRFSSVAGPEKAQLSMRGFSSAGFGRTKVLVDGRSLGYPDMQSHQWFSIPLQSVQRIEVARGGHGVLYGGGAVAGVINIITKDPQQPARMSASAELSSTLSDSYDSAVNYSEQLRFSLRRRPYDLSLDLSHRTGGGYRKRTENEQLNAAVSSGWDLTPLLRTELDVGYTSNSFELPGGLTEVQYETDPSQAGNPEDHGKMSELRSRLTAEWLPSDLLSLSLDSSYRYQWRETDLASSNSFTDKAYHIGEGGLKAVLDDPYGQVPWRVVAGLEGSAMRLKADIYGEEARSSLTNAFTVDQLNGGAYLRADTEPAQQLRLDAGLRYDAARISAKDDSGVDDAKLHRALVYDGGLTWNPVREAKVALRGGSLFRYPFTDEQASLYSAPGSFNGDLEAETGWNVELNTAWSGELVELKAGAYLLQMDDEIAFDMSTYENENLEATRRIGGEAELSAEPLEQLDLSARYSYVHAGFIEGPNEGNEVPLVPQHSGRFSAGIHLPRRITLSPSVEAYSEAWQGGDTANEQETIDPYTLVNLRVRWRIPTGGGALELIAEGENLLDTVYVTNAYYNSWSASSAYYPAPGRSVSLSASYRY